MSRPPDHSDLTDEEFLRQFECATPNAELFNHEAHLRMAWLQLRKYGVDEAIVRVDRQLRAYVTGLGAAEKYNKTLTIGGVRVVDHFMRKAPIAEFALFIREVPRLKTHFRELISAHYELDIFTSARARKEYVEPDRLPFT